MATSYSTFVASFITNVDSALEVEPTNAKRRKITQARNAVEARFVLGGDNNAYMQCGLTVLNVGTEGQKKELAPASLYNSDALQGLKRGLMRAELRESTDENAKKSGELLFVAQHVIRTFLKIDEVNEFLKAADSKLNDLIVDGPVEAKDLSVHPLFPQMLRFLLFLVARDDAEATKLLSNEVFEYVKTRTDDGRRAAAKGRLDDANRDGAPDWLYSAENALRISQEEVKAQKDRAENAVSAKETAVTESKNAKALADTRVTEAQNKAEAADALALERINEARDEAKASIAEAQEQAEGLVFYVETRADDRVDAAEAEALERINEADDRIAAAKAVSEAAANARVANIEADTKRRLEAAKKANERSNEAQEAFVNAEAAAKRAEAAANARIAAAEAEAKRARESLTETEAKLEKLQEALAKAKSDLQEFRKHRMADADLAKGAILLATRKEEELEKLEKLVTETKSEEENATRLLRMQKQKNLEAKTLVEQLEAERDDYKAQLGKLGEQSEAEATAASTQAYMHHRGLFGHRAPHEAASADPDATDRILKYQSPSNIGITIRLANDLPDVQLIKQEAPFFNQRSIAEASEALGGNYAIDHPSTETTTELSTPRQVRWLPTGPFARDACRAAVLEHAAARFGRVANDNIDGALLSDSARLLLLATAARFKINQIEPLNAISIAMVNGQDMPTLGTDETEGTPLVTRPVATIGGRMLFAHDAHEEHVAPTTGVLIAPRSAWNTDARRKNYEHRKWGDTAVFLCPPSSSLHFHPAPAPQIGAPPVERPNNIQDVAAQVGKNEYTTNALLKLVRYGLYFATLPTNAEVEAKQKTMLAGLTGTPEGRREGLWNEFHREIAISTDRLFVFVRTLSGLIGDDVDSLISPADEATMRAAKEMREQRKTTADRVTSLHSKLVETLVGGVLKESKLQLATLNPNTTPVVIDGDVRKQINDLASGESGRPFFEANVALRQMVDRSKDTTGTSLADFVASVTKIVSDLQNQMDSSSADGEALGATLAELSAPRNSYFIRLKADVAAAIRDSFDKFTVESRSRGIGRNVSLWELIEGRDDTLSSRFAAFVGHVLIQNRTSTGVSALYVGRITREVNASSAMVSLQRLCNHALGYAAVTQAPVFSSGTGRTDYFSRTVSDAGVPNKFVRYAGPFHMGGWREGVWY